MKKLLVCTLSLITVAFGIHVERINFDPSDIISISEAEARRGGGGRRGGGRRAHRSVNVNRSGGRGGAFVAGAIVGSAIASRGSRHAHLPPRCSSYRGSYYYCGGVYYQPFYDGPNVVYVVVDRP